MGKEIRADATELAKLAKATLDASSRLGDSFRNAQNSITISTAAFGNSREGRHVHQAYQRTVETTDTTTARFISVLEGDVDRLYRTAFFYGEAEKKNTRLINGLPVHTPSPSSVPPTP